MDTLKATRQAIGLSRSQLAASAGLSAKMVEAVELGARRPSAPTVCRIEAALMRGALDRLAAVEHAIASVPPLDPEEATP